MFENPQHAVDPNPIPTLQEMDDLRPGDEFWVTAPFDETEGKQNSPITGADEVTCYIAISPIRRVLIHWTERCPGSVVRGQMQRPQTASLPISRCRKEGFDAFCSAFSFRMSCFTVLACLAKNGKQCIFPFSYRNVTDEGVQTNITYKSCSSLDIHRPWCPTGTAKARCSASACRVVPC